MIHVVQTWMKGLERNSRTSSMKQMGLVGPMQRLQGGLLLSRQGLRKTAKQWISATSLLASGWRTVMMLTLLMLVGIKITLQLACMSPTSCSVIIPSMPCSSKLMRP